jgi:hypothetical protein
MSLSPYLTGGIFFYFCDFHMQEITNDTLFLLNIYNSLQKLGTLLYKVLDNFISLQPKS